MENYFAMTMDKGAGGWDFGPGAGPYGRRRFRAAGPELALRSRQDQGAKPSPGDGVLCVRPGSGPVLWSVWSPSSAPRSTTYTAGGGPPISTPFPSTPPPRNTPGPPAWSASSGTCSWREDGTNQLAVCHSHGGAIWHLTHTSCPEFWRSFGPRPWGARVEKIHQPTRDTIILLLRCSAGRQRLLIAANPTAPGSTSPGPIPKIPTSPRCFACSCASTCPAAAW